MADILGVNFNAGGMVASLGSRLIQSLWIIFIMIIFLAIVFLFIYVTAYKHKVRIRELVNGRKIVFDDKAREIRKKDGTKYWRLLRRREDIPIPIAHAIDIDYKGKKIVEVYRTETGEYEYLKDNMESKNFQPFDSIQREMLANQIIKAQLDKGLSLMDIIQIAVPAIAMVMLVAVFLLFFGEAVAPMQEVGHEIVAVSGNLENIIKTCSGRQYIEETAVSGAPG